MLLLFLIAHNCLLNIDEHFVSSAAVQLACWLYTGWCKTWTFWHR